MLIDWFTIVAQIVNFLILVVLLKRFLYKPILNAMDERAKAVASKMEEALQKESTADQEAASYREKIHEFDIEREAMVVRVTEETEAYRKELISAARLEIDSIKKRWQEAVLNEKDAFLDELRERVQKQIYTIARRVLADLSGTDLEQHMVDAFIHRLQALSAEELETITASISEDTVPVCMIRSATDIPEPLRQRIITALQTQLDEVIEAQFEIVSQLICGIELKVGGYKLAWNVDDFLKTLEEQVSQAIEEEVG